MSRDQSANVQGRSHEELVQRGAITFVGGDLEFLPQLGLDIWNFCQRIPIGLREWAHLIGEALDQDTTVFVAHGIDQVRESDRRVRNPVPVVPIVQTLPRSVERELQIDHASRTKEQLHPTALVDRPVAEDPGIGTQSVRIFREIGREMRRARLFFTFKNETKVHCRLDVGEAQRVERGQHGDDWRLIVPGRTREEAPLRIDRLRFAPIDFRSRDVAHDRFPRSAFPLRAIDWLAIVMRVKRNRPLRAGRGEIGKNNRRRALDREQLHLQPAFFAERADGFRIPLHIRQVAGYIRQHEEIGELRQNFAFVLRAPTPRLLSRRRRFAFARKAHDQKREERAAHGLTNHFRKFCCRTRSGRDGLRLRLSLRSAADNGASRRIAF